MHMKPNQTQLPYLFLKEIHLTAIHECILGFIYYNELCDNNIQSF